jgi:gamma-glutamylaminecyclotransferase
MQSQDKQPEQYRVFVYGTLRKGFSNHRLLNHSGATFVSDAKTIDKYRLTADGIPFVFKQFSDIEITGEVYDVDSNVLSSLDRLEGHPFSYKREIVPTTAGDAWIYFVNSSECFGKKISSGDFNDYRETLRW